MEEINPVPPVVKPRPSFKIPLLAVFIVLMMGLSSLVTYLILKSPVPVQTPESVVQTSPAAIVQPTPTPDPTANWKMYTNTKYNYEIKYPLDYFVNETSSDYVRFSPGPDDPSLPQRQTYLSIQLDNNPQNLAGIIYKKTSDGKTLKISQIMMDIDDSQKPQIKNIFDQILSTFKFLE